MSPDLRRKVLELYDEVGRAVAKAGPVCVASGRCCHFKEFDHVLFVTSMEAEILLEKPPPPDGPSLPDRCPYQKNKLCTAHDRRPLGCRIYYCDPGYQETAHQISEEFLRKLKALAEEHGEEWRYAPLQTFMEAGGAP